MIGCTPPAGSPGTETDASSSSSSSSSTSDSSTSPTSTDSTTSGGESTTTTTGEPDTGTTIDTEGPQPPDPVVPLDEFTCSGASWVHVDPAVSVPGASLLTSDGRLVVSSYGKILVFDSDGVPTTAFDFGPNYSWGGLDAQDRLYLTFEDKQEDRLWLRKFDLAGSLLWEVDRGVSDDPGFERGLVYVAPDGHAMIASAFSIRVERYDADGGLIYDKQIADKPFHHVLGMNDAGQIAAARRGPDGAVLMLDADANVVWEQPRALGYDISGAIDAAGNIAVASEELVGVLRYAPDGALVSDAALDLAPLVEARPHDLALNAAGDVALAILDTAGQHPVAVAVAVDSGGGVLATHQCDPASRASSVEIDASGKVYMTGYVYAEDGEHLFAAAF